jgi:hypothetical protein
MAVALLISPNGAEITQELRKTISKYLVRASETVDELNWSGTPSKILGGYYKWDIVESVTEATRNAGRKPEDPQPKVPVPEEVDPSKLASLYEASAAKISGEVIRTRRSSVSMLNSSVSKVPKFSKTAFLRILGKVPLGLGVDSFSSGSADSQSYFLGHVLRLELRN